MLRRRKLGLAFGQVPDLLAQSIAQPQCELSLGFSTFLVECRLPESNSNCTPFRRLSRFCWCHPLGLSLLFSFAHSNCTPFRGLSRFCWCHPLGSSLLSSFSLYSSLTLMPRLRRPDKPSSKVLTAAARLAGGCRGSVRVTH